MLNLGRPKEAKEAFELCVRLNPKNDDYKVQVEKAKREMFAGMSEAEILKVEGNDVRRSRARVARLANSTPDALCS